MKMTTDDASETMEKEKSWYALCGSGENGD